MLALLVVSSILLTPSLVVVHDIISSLLFPQKVRSLLPPPIIPDIEDEDDALPSQDRSFSPTLIKNEISLLWSFFLPNKSLYILFCHQPALTYNYTVVHDDESSMMITIVATATPNENQKKEVAALLGIPIMIIGPFFSNANWTMIISSPLLHQTNALLQEDIKTESETFGLVEFPAILPMPKPLPM